MIVLFNLILLCYLCDACSCTYSSWNYIFVFFHLKVMDCRVFMSEWIELIQDFDHARLEYICIIWLIWLGSNIIIGTCQNIFGLKHNIKFDYGPWFGLSCVLYLFVYVLEIGNIICNIFLVILYFWLFHPNWKTLLKCKKIGREEVSCKRHWWVHVLEIFLAPAAYAFAINVISSNKQFFKNSRYWKV